MHNLPAPLLLFLVCFQLNVLGAPLEGAQPLTASGDLSAQMVQGIDRFLMKQTATHAANRSNYWHRDFTSREAYEKSIETNRNWLRRIIGLTELPPVTVEVELLATTARPALLAENSLNAAYSIRWSAFSDVHGEGLWLRPKGETNGTVICLPDADQTPEMLAGIQPGLSTEMQFARVLAENGFEVFIPVLINRDDTFSGNAELKRFTNQPHREWIYRQAYELGAHIIGYEVQKILSLVEWLEKRGARHTGVAGYGEGGLIAFYAAALDPRIQATMVSGYFGPRERLWEEPIYRNVFGLLERAGDAEIASMIGPRELVVEYSNAPDVKGPSSPRQGRGGAAPGRIWTPERHEVEDELNRAREFFPRGDVAFELVYGQEGTPVGHGSLKALSLLAKALGHPEPLKNNAISVRPSMPLEDPNARQQRQIAELVDFTQHLITRTERERNEKFWQPALKQKAEGWTSNRPALRDAFWADLIGRFPDPLLSANPRARQVFDEPKWTGYEVMLDVLPDVYAWGILCVPKDLQAGERRPVVVCQHGLEGVPRDTIDGPNSNGYGPYKAFTARLAERGFITFAPHNPYRGQDKFRVLQRKGNPLGKSLFSVIIAQHEQILNWLETLPFVDPKRIGFYGLSYGGKTAMRVPAVLDRYVLSICSADFNDWVKKNATVHSTYSYLFTGEYEMPEFALSKMWNYAEMAALVAPRPFMVERGHDDGVAPDEWVAYEFAKVKRFYDKLGIGEKAEMEVFDGPHTINGVGTFDFLHKHLNWPEPEEGK